MSLFIGCEYIIQGWLQEFLEINPKPKLNQNPKANKK